MLLSMVGANQYGIFGSMKKKLIPFFNFFLLDYFIIFFV